MVLFDFSLEIELFLTSKIRSTYFPIKSFSRFTVSPMPFVDNIVAFIVCGMIETEKLLIQIV